MALSFNDMITLKNTKNQALEVQIEQLQEQWLEASKHEERSNHRQSMNDQQKEEMRWSYRSPSWKEEIPTEHKAWFWKEKKPSRAAVKVH